jgi:bacterioferritin-associated ferredoxin
MIVCSCNVLTDADIKNAIQSEACPRTPGAICRCLGCSPSCGRCFATFRILINESLPETAPGSAPYCPDLSAGAEALCSL